MKVIFLDIDGVLNGTRTAIAYKGYGPGSNRPGSTFYSEHEITDPKLDPVAVNMLRVLVEETGAKIVISSTWRMHYTPQAFANMFRDVYDWDAPVIDRTPVHFRMSGRYPRGGEISEWLEDKPEVTKYVIIDDDTDMLPYQIEHHFVNTCSHNGFSFQNFERALEILGKLDETEKV